MNDFMSTITIPDFHQTVPIDKVGVEERVSRLNKRSIKKESKVQALKLALSMIDLTTLEGKDSEGKVIQMCRKARTPYAPMPDLPHVAAVCVYPTMVATAKKAVEGHQYPGCECIYGISKRNGSASGEA
jgi:deoxyribose-phosphate aldolase